MGWEYDAPTAPAGITVAGPTPETPEERAQRVGTAAPPSSGDRWGAWLRQENPIGSAAAFYLRGGVDARTVDPNFDPFERIKGTRYAERAAEFVYDGSEADVAKTMARLDKEDRDSEIVDGTPALQTVMYGLGAEVLNPFNYYPAGGVVRGARGGWSVARSAASAGAAGAASAAASEVVLQSTQSNRTATDSLVNIGSSTFMGALFGAGAAKYLTGAEKRYYAAVIDMERLNHSRDIGQPVEPALAKEIETEVVAAREALDGPATSVAAPQSAGAAAADQRSLVPVPTFLTKEIRLSEDGRNLNPLSAVMRNSNPLNRTFFGEFTTAKRAMADLVESPLRFVDNLVGIPTTYDAPVETVIKTEVRAARAAIAVELDALWTSYRTKGAVTDQGYLATQARKAAAAWEQSTAGPDAERMLTSAEFKREVGRALRRGDRHDIPEIAQAAAFMRQRVFDPWKNKILNSPTLKEAFGWPDDVDPKTAESYFMRVYNREKIVARRPEFAQRIAGWMEANEAANAKVAGALPALIKQRDIYADQMRKLESRLATRSPAQAAPPTAPPPPLRAEGRLLAVGEADATVVKKTWRADAPYVEVETMLEAAPANQARLAQEADAIAADLGLKFKNPGVKALPLAQIQAIADEAARAKKQKGYDRFVEKAAGQPKPGAVTDLVRGGFDISSPKQGDEIVARLAQRFNVIDEGWVETPVGYFDRKVYVRFDDGMIGEVQLWEPSLLRAKEEGGGHKLYEQWRSLPPDDPRRAELETQMKGVYGAARAKLGQDWVSALGTGGSSPNRDLNLASPSSLASSPMTPLSTLDQAPSRNTYDQPEVQRSGSPSQEQKSNFIGGSSTPDVGTFPAESQDLASQLDAAIRGYDNARRQIEDTLAKWQGKTTADAMSAIKQRAKLEAERQAKIDGGSYKGKGARMTSADDAVDAAVRHILDEWQPKDRQEILSRAEQIVSRIIGSPDGRLPYDVDMSHGQGSGNPSARGPLARRDFMIPDELIEDFLEDDAERVAGIYLNTMVPDVTIVDRFGDLELTLARQQIDEEGQGRIRAATTEKQRTAINKEMERRKADLLEVSKRMRGLYGIPATEVGRQMARAARVLKQYDVLTNMGGQTIASLNDMATPVMRYGADAVFGRNWPALMKSAAGDKALWKGAERQLKALGIGVDVYLNTRNNAVLELDDVYRGGTRLERGMSTATDLFQIANLSAPWTDIQKIAAGTIAMDELLRAVKASAAGKATKKQVAFLAENSIDGGTAQAIWREFSNGGGEVVDGIHLSNSMDWKNERARRMFEAALSRETDLAVITPGQEKPLWLSTVAGSLIGMYKSYALSATERILHAGLQRSDRSFAEGVFASFAAGVLSYAAYQMAAGKDLSDNPADYVREGISRSGVTGWLEEVNTTLSKFPATEGRLDIYRLIGSERPGTKYASRDFAGQLMGPAFGKVKSILEAGGNLAGAGLYGAGVIEKNPWSASDSRSVQRLVIGQNLFYIRRLADAITEGINQALGIPDRAVR
jgi:hypothetical protein